MAIGLEYKDPVKLISTTVSTDGYGTEVVESVNDVMGLFLSNTGWQHGNYRSEILSDAEMYIDPEDEFVVANAYRLEGMYILANRFGGEDVQEWYKITNVIIGEDKLLDNQIDNISLQLKKTSEVPNVS